MSKDEEIIAALESELGITLWPHQLQAFQTVTPGTALEMKTGEGKTFVLAALAAREALSGNKVHVLTANEYLADRDLEWVRSVFDKLGLTSGRIGASFETLPDIQYGTIKEAARQDLSYHLRTDYKIPSPKVGVAVVDEADAVLLDSARESVILSHPMPPNVELLRNVKRLAAMLEEGDDYVITPETKVPIISDSGQEKIFQITKIKNVYSVEGTQLMRRLFMALIAKSGMIKGVEYTVVDEQIVLIDQATGREHVGTRLNNGLSQALEAEEDLEIGDDYVTRHRITVGEFLQQYETLYALGGTLWEDRKDIADLYGMKVKRMKRQLARHLTVETPIWVGDEEKATVVTKAAIAEDAPTLIVCASPGEAEYLGKLLPQAAMILPGDRFEAVKILEAGKTKDKITIITPMSARGVDLVDETGQGFTMMLYSIMPTKRLQRQVSGRIARREEPGKLVQFMGIDDVMFRGLSPRKKKLVNKYAVNKKGRLHARVEKAIGEYQDAQSSQFNARRRALIQFDHLTTPYRRKYHAIREELLAGQGIDMEKILWQWYQRIKDEASDKDHLGRALAKSIPDFIVDDSLDEEMLDDNYFQQVMNYYQSLRTPWHDQVECQVALRMIDPLWMDYMALSEEMADGVWLRVHARQNPYTEYGYELRDGWARLYQEYGVLVGQYMLKARVAAHDEAGNEVVL